MHAGEMRQKMDRETWNTKTVRVGGMTDDEHRAMKAEEMFDYSDKNLADLVRLGGAMGASKMTIDAARAEIARREDV